jgi:hypothetical protein
MAVLGSKPVAEVQGVKVFIVIYFYMGNYEYSVHLPVVSCSQDILVWHRVEYIA